MKIFNLPDLGEGLAEAEIREWYINEGDTVKVDQPLVSMETAKAVVDVPSPYAGKITKLHGKANDIIKTGAPLIEYEMEGGAKPANAPAAKEADKGSVVGKLETSEKKWDDTQMIVGSATSKSTSIKAMPAARVLASQMGVDLNTINGSGPQGLITPDDIKKVLGGVSKPAATSVALEGMEEIRGVRRAMSQAMTQSHAEIVPVTIIEDVDISHFPPKTDITALILKAIVAACKAEPSLNAWYDGNKLARKVFPEVHIGLAVDTDEGLFVPVIRNAENKSAEELRKAVDDYKTNVKERKVAPKDLQGATISLSNFGMITGKYATPIIVPPMVAILGCGRSREMPVVKDGKIAVGKVMPLSLTFDHRAVTGGEATRFLGTIIKNL